MKICHPESLESFYYQKWQNKAKKLTLNSIRPKFTMKITVSVESFGYVKCYSMSSPRPNKSPSTYLRDTIKRSACEPRILETGKKSNFWSSQKSHIFSCKIFKGFINRSKKTNSAVLFSCVPLPNNLKCIGNRLDLPKFWENMIPSNRYWKIQLVCMKLQGLVVQNDHQNKMETRRPW